MPRGAKPTPLWLASEEWRAARGHDGRWIVVNTRGEEPLQHSDATTRMRAVYLAASAPTLRALLVSVATRWQRYILSHGMGYTSDMELVRTALVEVAHSRPSFEQQQHEQQRARGVPLRARSARGRQHPTTRMAAR